MLFSLQKQFLFIHVQKTGGNAIETALAPCSADTLRHSDMPGVEAASNPLRLRHLFATDIKLYFSDETWNSLFKFAFVRNPWARMLSWYNMASRSKRPDHPFSAYVRTHACTFEEFLSLTDGIAAKTLHNQVDYISDRDGSVIVDFVGRFENLTADFGAVCQTIGVSTALPPFHRTVVDYRAYYTDRTAELIANRFARDIAKFGYVFDEQCSNTAYHQ